jgi:hypothetical protein
MPEKKSQHFVSQFILRYFARSESKKLIGLYHIPGRRYVPRAEIKHQACGDYFYEKGKEIENALNKMEGEIGPIISGAVEREELPRWTSKEHAGLLRLVVLQSERTQLAVDEMKESQEKLIQKITELAPGAFPGLEKAKIDPAELPRSLLQQAEIALHVCHDLRCKMLRNRSAIPFITSDHPVVRYNQLYEEPQPIMSNTGFGCRGIQLFFPLNPKYLLVIFDSDVYTVGGRNFRTLSVDAGEEDVNTLNLLQVVNAGEHLYFNDGTEGRYIEELVKKAERFLRKEKGRARSGPAVVAGIEHGQIVAMQRVDIQIGLNLRSMRVLPKADRYRVRDPRVRIRSPELVDLISQFLRKVTVHNPG